MNDTLFLILNPPNVAMFLGAAMSREMALSGVTAALICSQVGATYICNLVSFSVCCSIPEAQNMLFVLEW